MKASLRWVIQCVISVASRVTTGRSVPSCYRELPQYKGTSQDSGGASSSGTCVSSPGYH